MNSMERMTETVVETYGLPLFRFAYSYLKNSKDAEDIVQDTLLAMLERQPVFISESGRKAWLFKVASSKCKNILAHRARKKMVMITPAMEKELIYLPRKDYELLQFVLSLEEKYRVTIHLFYYEGYSIKQIAKILKQKPSTIGTWLDRGRKILKNILGEQWYGE